MSSLGAESHQLCIYLVRLDRQGLIHPTLHDYVPRDALHVFVRKHVAAQQGYYLDVPCTPYTWGG